MKHAAEKIVAICGIVLSKAGQSWGAECAKGWFEPAGIRSADGLSRRRGLSSPEPLAGPAGSSPGLAVGGQRGSPGRGSLVTPGRSRGADARAEAALSTRRTCGFIMQMCSVELHGARLG